MLNPLSHLFAGGVYISGILALISCICYAIFAILSVIQIAMITSRDKVVLKYKPLVIIKLTLACVAGKHILVNIHFIRSPHAL